MSLLSLHQLALGHRDTWSPELAAFDMRRDDASGKPLEAMSAILSFKGYCGELVWLQAWVRQMDSRGFTRYCVKIHMF